MAGLYPLRPLQQAALDQSFYVYVLFRKNGIPCYVGKGRGRRWLKHEKHSHSAHLKAIFRSAGGDLPRVKIRENISESEAMRLEVALISAIGREAIGGPLVNQTDGGDGISGWKHTEAVRAKMSASRQGENAPFLGKHLSVEAKAALRESHLGTKHSDETRAKMSFAHRGRVHSEATKAKMSASQSGDRHAMYGRKHSPLARQKIGDWSRGVPKSDDTRARMAEGQRRRWAKKEDGLQ